MAAVQGDDAALAQAWEPDSPNAGTSPAASTLVVQEPAPPDRRAAFRAVLFRGEQALRGKRLEEARAAADEACASAEILGASERARAWPLAYKVAAAEGDAGRAETTALAWRRACGPDAAEACRAAALRALEQSAKLPDARAEALKALSATLRDADACVARAMGASRAPSCLTAAAKTAQQHRDDYLATQVALARALAERKAPRRRALLEKVDESCRATACAGLRREALAKLSALAVAAKDVEAAARLALRDMAIAASLAQPEERLWVRPATVDKACAKYEATAGEGACRKLEHQVNGGWSFRDYSKGPPVDGLSPEQVKAVNEHYAPLLQECLEAQARRLKPPDAERFEVSWTVQNDGRVRDAHLRRDLEDSLLAKCLRQQFAPWRYPRFTGELQHIEQSFLVSAVEHRVP